VRLRHAPAAFAFCLASSALAADGCGLVKGVTAEEGRAGRCGFLAMRRAFAGTAAEQAECLTRAVGWAAKIGEPTLTPFLRERVGRPTGISVERFSTYIAGLGVAPDRLGGSIGVPLAASYFVIHDTSAPNCSEEEWGPAVCPERGLMPAARDGADWARAVGFLGHPKLAPRRLAHAFTNRVGESITEVEYDEPMVTTRFERCADRASKRGLFVGVENIQPRIGVPPIPKKGEAATDYVAPRPGFTAPQYDRLALLYVTASVRRGRWMIPAFHAVLDSYYAGGHDDPQNFDMPAFSDAVARHTARLAE